MKITRNYPIKKLVIVCFIISLFPIVTFAFEEIPDGFRGFKIGADFKKSPNMVLKKSNGVMGYFIKKNDILKIGDARVTDIEYIFKETGNSSEIKFYGAMVLFDGFDNYERIRKDYQKLYGRGEQWAKHPIFSWDGKYVTIMLRYSEKLKKGKLVYLPSEEMKARYRW